MIIMKLTLCLLGLTFFGVNLHADADVDPVTYYFQLVRGTERDVPDDPKWKPVGERLGNKLRSVFRAKNYWEVSRQKASVKKERFAEHD